MTIRVAIHGAAGRMGRRLVALGFENPEFEVVAAIESPDHPSAGKDIGLVAGLGEIGVPITSALPHDTQAVIDFSVPAAAVDICTQCQDLQIPLVLATTGLNEQQLLLIRRASQTIAICQAPNMSLAVNLGMKLCEITGRALKNHSSGVDVEILECHHRYKEDAPSGTALAFGHMIAAEMGQSHHQHGREGRPGARPRNEIGYHAIRAGDNPGEHTIVFGMLGETIEIRVAATSRNCYAQGALAAAQWLLGQSAGMYDMQDVSGLKKSD